MAAPSSRDFGEPYRGAHLDRIAFPLGGLGTGMVAFEGTGGFSQVSLRHRPKLEHAPILFLAVQAGDTARVLEGPVPRWKAVGGPGVSRTIGLPRFAEAVFRPRFPFAEVALSDPALALSATVTAWSPFVPADPDASSLPLAVLEVALTHHGSAPLQATVSLHAEHLLAAGSAPHAVRPVPDGVVLDQPGTPERPWDAGQFALFAAPGQDARADCAWFRGGWWDPLTMVWRRVQAGAPEPRAPHPTGEAGGGASLYVPLDLAPRETGTVRLGFAWHVPRSDLRAMPFRPPPDERHDVGPLPAGDTGPTHTPWYAGVFDDIDALLAWWRDQGPGLRARTAAFADCLHGSTLPPVLREAVSANLSNLRTPTVLRQSDGRLWRWEGSWPDRGSCAGSCNHVYNYAQAVPHLFPSLARRQREAELDEGLDDRGHQSFRLPLPIAPADHSYHPAADGQLGTILQVHREWRIHGDTAWLRPLWPRLVRSLAYCIATWDPEEQGLLTEPHHNTYDVRFWGPDSLCGSLYAGALAAACAMGEALGEDTARYRALHAEAVEALENRLFQGSWFVQEVSWRDAKAGSPVEVDVTEGGWSTEARELLEAEGPRYQVGGGVLSDGVLGDWLARCCGVGPLLDPGKVGAHLDAVIQHNRRDDLRTHSNPQRPVLAFGAEGGLLLCSWPHGDAPTLPFVYADEIWTGIEYQVAAHALQLGRIAPALAIVRAARRRYDGRWRNPFDEIECGRYYGRALSSFSLLQAWTGVRYDAVTRTLFLDPVVPGDFAVLLCTATGFGLVGLSGGEPFVEVHDGTLDVQRISLPDPAAGA